MDRGGKYRRYAGATIYWKSTTGAWEVHGHILLTYNDVFGGPAGVLGYPRTDELSTADLWGRYNDFRFLTTKAVGEEPGGVAEPAPELRIRIVLNWTQELLERVPVD